MPLTRRAFAGGGAVFAAGAIMMPGSRAQGAQRAQGTLGVRRSINELIRAQSPTIESFRRAVDVMMAREVTDKTSWWFQANIHDLPEEELAQHRSFARYWQQCPHKNYFFLSWHRIYLHFFERIARKASGDPDFMLPYWGYEDPLQASLPTAFVPDPDEFAPSPDKDPVPPPKRRNPLARAKRIEHVDRRWIGLGDVARDVKTSLALDRFTAADKLDALAAFGGVRSDGPLIEQAAGAIEASPHNLVHTTIGLEGLMGSPETAARDPIFWPHHANIDRLWVKWTDPARGRVPPLDDDVWMNTKFTFVDEDGNDQVMTGADVLDNQFQLGYRYDDEPPRAQRFWPQAPAAVARAPGGPSASDFPRATPGERSLRATLPSAPVVVARAPAVRLAAVENKVALAAIPADLRGAAPANVPSPRRLRVVLRNVIARDGVPPYDVFLVLENPGAAATSVRVGGLDLFGSAGPRGHDGRTPNVEIVAYEASAALAELRRTAGFDMTRLRVSIVRRSFASTAGGQFTPADPDPPRIGSIELLQS
jgi:tyrosinase